MRPGNEREWIGSKRGLPVQNKVEDKRGAKKSMRIADESGRE